MERQKQSLNFLVDFKEGMPGRLSSSIVDWERTGPSIDCFPLALTYSRVPLAPPHLLLSLFIVNDEGAFVAQTHVGSDSSLLINLPLSSLCNLGSLLQTMSCFLLVQFSEGEWLPLASDLVISCKDVLASLPFPPNSPFNLWTCLNDARL